MTGHGFSLLVVAIALAAGCSSCFTGIESTPRITREDVGKSGVSVTEEQTFADLIKGTASRDWKAGKQWLVTDNKIALIFAGSPADVDSLSGQTITLDGISPISTITGVDNIELRFKDPKGQLLSYRTDVPADDWGSRATVPIPFAVELTPVAIADSLLKGKTLYITTPLWYDKNGQMIRGLRHIPVTVNRVVPGTANYPLCVAFTPGEGDPTERFILMTYGKSTSATRNFDRLFSFDNPRLRYPQITDKTWALIVRSQVAEGMTRDEARLALGTPASIDRGYTRGSLQMERWSYDNGVYLIFEEGFLIRFRK